MTLASRSKGSKLSRETPRAPEARAGTPAEQLREDLARLKSHGITFSAAWRSAISRIVWPPDGQTRKEWKAAVEATRPEWERCYHDCGEVVRIEDIVELLGTGELTGPLPDDDL